MFTHTFCGTARACVIPTTGSRRKTSGLPTLEAIRHAGLVDCIVVTTRYFGGTLLGTGGLVRAYTAAANAVLAAAKQVTVQVCVRGVLRVEYPLYELAQRLLADAGARLRGGAVRRQGNAALCDAGRR